MARHAFAQALVRFSDSATGLSAWPDLILARTLVQLSDSVTGFGQDMPGHRQALVQLSDAAIGLDARQNLEWKGLWSNFLTRLLGFGKTC